MSIRIVALTHLAYPLVGLLAVSGACNATGGDLGTGGNGGDGVTSGGRGGSSRGGTSGSGGDHSGGASGEGGAGGIQDGSGGSGDSPRGGSGGGRGGASGSAGPSGGGGASAGKDAAAGGRAQGGAQGGALGEGSGGARSAIDAGPVACDDTQSPGRLGVYFYNNSKASDQALQMHFDIVNYTAYTARMQQVTVRYWFTDDDPTAANVVEQYYVPITTTMKFSTLNPPRTGANTVLEMSFRDAPDAGISWVETKGFNFAFHKASYAGTYDQTNDYSYDPKLTTALGLNPKITAYVNGVLAWGCEPTVQPVVVDAGGESIVDAGDSVDAPIVIPDVPPAADDAPAGGG
jgi:hypothetical protein